MTPDLRRIHQAYKYLSFNNRSYPTGGVAR